MANKLDIVNVTVNIPASQTVEFSRLKAGEIVGPNPLRTDVTFGLMDKSCLKIGERAALLSSPLTEGATGRFIQTSPITHIVVGGDAIVIQTESGSIYQIRDIGGLDDVRSEKL